MFFKIFLISIAVLIVMKVLENIFDKSKQNKQTIQELIETKHNTDAVFISNDKHSALALDKNNNLLHVILAKKQASTQYEVLSYNERKIDLGDILESELIIDDETITSSSRGSQIGGALVGGVLLGGAGAIIGGLSGKKKSKKRIGKIDIKLTINDLSNPVCRINILPQNRKDGSRKHIPYEEDSRELSNGLKEAEKWQSLMTIILNENKTKSNA